MRTPIPHSRPARRLSRGFTLVELLVVVAILALLITLLMPTLGRAKDLARSAICATNLHAHGRAVDMFAENWDGFLPPVTYSRPRHPNPPWHREGPFWEFDDGAQNGHEYDTVNGEGWDEERNYSPFWIYYQPIYESGANICKAHPRAGEAGTGDFGLWGANRTYYLMNSNAGSRWKPVEPYMVRRKVVREEIWHPAKLFRFTDRRDYLTDEDLDRTTISFAQWGPTISSGSSVGSSFDDIGTHHFGGFNACYSDGHVKRIDMGLEDSPLAIIASMTQGPLRRENFMNEP